MDNLIKSCRKKRRITQTNLADAVLTTRQTIYLIEQNKVIPSLKLAFKLADYFNKTIEELFIYKKDHSTKEEVFFIFEKDN
jgi:putative transcriptional regulator